MNTIPYSKFSVLPQLNKLQVPLFVNKLRKPEKYKAALDGRKTFMTLDCPDDLLRKVCQYIIIHHPLQYYLEYPTTFEKVCGEIWEDVLIHRMYKGKDWLAAIHSTFPNGWLPEQNIGKSFIELHNHVPGINLANAKKVVETCINYGPFERYVWGVFHDDTLDGHPNAPASKFDPSNPKLFVRVETQIIVGMPEIESFMFVLRQQVIRHEDVDKRILLNTLLSMSPEQLLYKRISVDIINYLKKETSYED